MDEEGLVLRLRTNMEFTLKERRMKRSDLDEFVSCYNPENRNQRKALWDEKKNLEGRWRVFKYEELIARDKCSLDIFWLKERRPTTEITGRGKSELDRGVEEFDLGRRCGLPHTDLSHSA